MPRLNAEPSAAHHPTLGSGPSERGGARRVALRRGPGLGATLLALACRSPSSSAPPPATAATTATETYIPYEARRAAHATRLRRDEPSSGRYDADFVPDGARRVYYRSTDGELLAWLFVPPDHPTPVPGLVYVHGAFSLGPKDARAIRPFVEAGFAVLTPALRAENGNPGRQELLYGEVDDALAATRWLGERPEVDARHLYAIGHSIGGGVAAMLALRSGAPLRLTGSVGGLYVPETFQRWSRSSSNGQLIRFDPFDRDEGELRTLGANVRDLAVPHYAYIGEEDPWFHPNAEAIAAEAARWDAPFRVTMVAGDHMSSLTRALDQFLTRIRADAEPS